MGRVVLWVVPDATSPSERQKKYWTEALRMLVPCNDKTGVVVGSAVVPKASQIR